MIKVLVGQRRVGKSYLLYHVVDMIKDRDPACPILYVNKELAAFDDIRTDSDLLDLTKRELGSAPRGCILIDEVQEIENWSRALRSLAAEKRFDIYCTGSNAEMLSGDIATLLAGRAVEVPVRGLSYGEFLAFHRLDESDESLRRYLRYGGLPHLVDLELTDRVVYEYLGNLYHVILFKDVVARYRIRNIDFLQRLVRFVADSVGSVVTAKRISDYLKSQRVRTSPNAVLEYLAHLCHACFLGKVHRADVVGRRIFEIGEKYYFEDLGLRHAVKPFVQPGHRERAREPRLPSPSRVRLAGRRRPPGSPRDRLRGDAPGGDHVRAGRLPSDRRGDPHPRVRQPARHPGQPIRSSWSPWIPSSAQATRASATSTSASSCRPSGDRSDAEFGAETIYYRGRWERLKRSTIRTDAVLASVSCTAPAPW